MQNKKPKTEKRVMVVKKPSSQERVSLSEKTEPGERALVQEKPNVRKRVRSRKESLEVERVTAGKETTRPERVNHKNQPNHDERAYALDNINVEKRAIDAENTEPGKRVRQLEQPFSDKRATEIEQSTVLKRASTFENTSIDDRAISDDNPNASERIDSMLANTANNEPDTRPLALILGRTFQSIQRLRVGLELSLSHRENIPEQTMKILSDLQAAENGSVDILSLECKASSIWPWLSGVKGIGPRLGGMLVALIDVHKAPTISSLWKFSGQSVTNGVCDKREKGVKLPYCDALKKTCYLIGDQFIKKNTQPYRQVYDEAKEFYLRTKPEWQQNKKAPKKHCEMAARRKMVKRFLSDLWVEWRRAEGLPVTEPYVVAYLGHKISENVK